MHRAQVGIATRIALPLLALALAVPAARAGRVPPSALSAALQTVPALVETGALAFEHPQRSALAVSSLSAFNTADYSLLSYDSNSAVAASWAAGRFAIEAQAQRQGYRGLYENLTMAAGQLAGRLGPVRLGAAYRRGKDKGSNEYERLDYSYTPPRRRWEYQRSFDLVREFAVGAGLSAGGVSADITATLVDVEREGVGQIEETSNPPQDRQSRLDSDERWGGSLRVRTPLPAAAGTLTLAASFQDLRSRMGFRELNQYLLPVTGGQDVYGHEWSAAAGLSRPLTSTGRVHVHCAYQDVRDPGRPSARYELGGTTAREDRLQGGVAVEFPGWWETTLYAGASVRRIRAWADALRWYNETVSREANHTEGVSQSFSWGVSRSVGSFDLAGTVSRTLSVADPIAQLDVRLRF